jgi:hypothetical protein
VIVETIFVGDKALLSRLIAPLFVAMGMGCVWVGWAALTGYDQQDAGGVAMSWVMRIVVGGLFLGMGLGTVALGCLYGLMYIARLEIDRARDVVRITLAGYVTGRSFTARPSDFVSAKFHSSGSAPWTTVRLHGRKLPLILDEFGRFDDPHAVDRLIRQHTLAT